MSAQNDGGPAFPVPDTYHPGGQVEYGATGMSLRDWFAGQALAGILMNYTTEKYGFSEQTVATYAYRYADVMIEARGAKK
jgi:hypothetical protein